MNQNEVLAISILRGGRSFVEAAELSGISVNLVCALWHAAQTANIPHEGA